MIKNVINLNGVQILSKNYLKLVSGGERQVGFADNCTSPSGNYCHTDSPNDCALYEVCAPTNDSYGSGTCVCA